MQDGDWFCKVCKVVIFRNKKECLKCKSPKPDYWEAMHTITPYKIGTSKNSGYDWNCPKCKTFIFGSKRYCLKCKIRNPVLPDDL
jgi:hypothetical protein